ncbi:MAG: hypothetical protein QOH24_1890 [Verrucomicrobiota bacterium]|jgi:hypothetical protein
MTTPAIQGHRPGGSARKTEIDGGVITHGEGIIPVELDGAIQSPWSLVNSKQLDR